MQQLVGWINCEGKEGMIYEHDFLNKVYKVYCIMSSDTKGVLYGNMQVSHMVHKKGQGFKYAVQKQ